MYDVEVINWKKRETYVKTFANKDEAVTQFHSSAYKIFDKLGGTANGFAIKAAKYGIRLDIVNTNNNKKYFSVDVHMTLL